MLFDLSVTFSLYEVMLSWLLLVEFCVWVWWYVLSIGWLLLCLLSSGVCDLVVVCVVSALVLCC